MNKERALKKVTGDFFVKIFKMGEYLGREVHPKKKVQIQRTKELYREYLIKKKGEFTKQLKKTGILPIR